MPIAYLGLGTNKGNKAQMLKLALMHISESAGKLVCKSKVYKTKASGHIGNDYLNAVVKIETGFSPQALLDTLLAIEKKMGRKQKTTFGADNKPIYHSRCIDIDILYYNELVTKTDRLQIPHPRLHERNFVLMPLCDIASDFLHPVFKLSNRELLQKIQS